MPSDRISPIPEGASAEVPATGTFTRGLIAMRKHLAQFFAETLFQIGIVFSTTVLGAGIGAILGIFLAMGVLLTMLSGAGIGFAIGLFIVAGGFDSVC